MRLSSHLNRSWKPKPQVRFGTVTSVSTGICTVQVAGGEIPAITLKGAPIAVGDFAAVQRQGVVSYVLVPPSGLAFWAIGNAGSYQTQLYSVTSGGVATAVGGLIDVFQPRSFTADTNGNLWIEGYSSQGDDPTVVLVSKTGTVLATVALGTGYQGGCLAMGTDGAMWVQAPGTAALDTTLYRMDLAGNVLSTLTWPLSWAMAIGPDGSFWEAPHNPPPAGPPFPFSTVTPGGAVSTYPLANDSNYTGGYGVCAGGGGTMWMSALLYAAYGGGVWRIQSDYTSDLFVFSGNSDATTTILGPDGSIYIADEFLGIWRVALDGSFGLVYAEPSGDNYGVSSVCAGKDGNVWGIDPQLSVFVRVSPDGSTATFPWTGYIDPVLVASTSAILPP